MEKKKIVIVGGSFAGANIAKELENLTKKDSSIEIALITKEFERTKDGNLEAYYSNAPILPMIVAGSINSDDAKIYLSKFLKKTEVIVGEASNIDIQKKSVSYVTPEGENRKIEADSLVIATGMDVNFFRMKDVEENSLTMKSVNDANRLVDKILSKLKAAQKEENKDKRREHLTFIIGGAGFTGIETAAATKQRMLKELKNYPRVQEDEIDIRVVEAMDRIMPSFSGKLANYVEQVFEERDIKIVTHTSITGYNGEKIKLKYSEKSKERLKNPGKAEEDIKGTLVWTAGGKAPKVIENVKGLKLNRGRIVNYKYLEVPFHDDVTVAGDIADGFPATAMTANQQAKIAAKNVLAAAKGQQHMKEDFAYNPLGQVADIGGDGVASIKISSHKNMELTGWAAELLATVIHLQRSPQNKRPLASRIMQEKGSEYKEALATRIKNSRKNASSHERD